MMPQRAAGVRARDRRDMQSKLSQRPPLFVGPPSQPIVRDALVNAARRQRFCLELLQHVIDYRHPSARRLVENRVTSVQPVAGPDRTGAASLAIGLHGNRPETARARCDGA
jgi:hypothetical protein